MANINESKKYHFIYKTTNLLSNKYYVGMHSTSNLKDGYLGSGTRLRRAIRKHGKENFQIEILEFLDSREELVQREKELVNEALLQDPMCINLKLGGSGGMYTKEVCSKGGTASMTSHWKDPEFQKRKSLSTSNRNKELWKLGLLKHVDHWTGRKHSAETIEKMKEVKARQGRGSKNSQYGTMWITDGVKNKKIKRDSEIPQTWYKGRA